MQISTLFTTKILLILTLLQIYLCASAVPDPLPKVCYSGGVKSNPCQGSACAPCWVQQADASWACYDYISDNKCQWGEDVGDRVAARGSSDNASSSKDKTKPKPNGSNNNQPIETTINGKATTLSARKYTATSTIVKVVTMSNSTREKAYLLSYTLMLLVCSRFLM